MRFKRGFIKAVLLTLFFTSIGFVPAGFSQTSSDAPVAGTAVTGLHEVQKGDTYYGLSRLYKVPVDSLQRWNGPDLKLGSTIRVKPRTATKEPVNSVAALAMPVESPAEKTQAPVSQNNSSVKSSADVSNGQRVLIIPFDPALYFSDADNDIAWQSKIPKQKVRYVFRARLNALLEAPGYQPINLLNNAPADSSDELNRIYKAVAYSYQDIKSGNYQPVAPPKEKGLKAWVKNSKEKIGLGSSDQPLGVAQDETKYYGAKVIDSTLFTTFKNTYGADNYIFINQFEIFTDYTNCIDRTTQNFVRNFRVHYTIMDDKGAIVAGNKILIPYVSNVNDINKIVRENLSKMAGRIMADLPKPETATNTAAAGN